MIIWLHFTLLGFPDGSAGKESACNAGDAGDLGSIPGSGRVPGVGNGNPLQYSCLESPMDRGAWLATVQRKGHKDLDTIKRQTTHYTLPYIAENQNTTFYKHFDELERSS